MSKGDVLIKTIRVIQSCETVEQLRVARSYASLAANAIDKNSLVEDALLRFDLRAELKNRAEALGIKWNF